VGPVQDPPTPKQLRYLRTLAQRTGETFTSPATKQQASSEIRRLRSRTTSSPADRRRERTAVQDDMASGGYATAVRDEEITGYGASAHWRESRR
jgi:hypothetical protein